MSSISIEKKLEQLEAVVVRFAGDSGDGMQIVGELFTDSTAILGNDISTFPDFPAEIRAPMGTLPGVSGFQIQFGKRAVLTPGDAPHALVAMNPAALKVNLPELVSKGLLVVNTAAFTPDNLKKAGYTENPLDNPQLTDKYHVVSVDMTSLTRDALADSSLKQSQKVQCKNFFALGFMYWVYSRSLEFTLRWIEKKWANKPEIAEANSRVLKAGYFYGETCESLPVHYSIPQAAVEPGLYRKISGNEAMVLGLAAVTEITKNEIVYGSYPITPASSILEGLSKLKNFPIKTVQAEDEIAAIGVALGASFAGKLGVTGTSGPGVALKTEFIGLGVMTELPLIIINVQRGGPSTGLPTKTEQSDLFQALFGRNGECPVVVLAPCSPSDCFNAVIEAAQISINTKTPVMVLSDGSLANGAEPWRIPNLNTLPIFSDNPITADESYVIYGRDPKTLARRIAYPGTPGHEHRIGGLEKNEKGEVSYDSTNHDTMVRLRAEKVARIAQSLPPTVVHGNPAAKLLIVGWGGTFGAISEAVRESLEAGLPVAAIHLRYLNPLPSDLEEILKRYPKILVPELNLGQLCFVLRGKYLVDAQSYTKIQGKPFTVAELKEKIQEILA